MHANDDFRFKAHEHLVDLEATTNQLMMLVVSDELTGKVWDDALTRQKCSYAAWLAVAENRTQTADMDPFTPSSGDIIDKPRK